MTRHGLSRTKIYQTWSDMCARCHNPKDTGFKSYGGRGITVCDEWRNDFQAFYDYVSKLEHFGEDGYTLDRIDVNGNYEPNNVRWATTKEQSRNKTNNRYVDVRGKKIILADLAEMSGLTSQLIRDRLERGNAGEQLLRQPKPKEHLVDIGGDGKVSITEAAKRAGVGRSTIQRRVKAGESGKQILRPAPKQNHYIEINGEKMILADVARAAGVTKKTIYKRLSLGASEDQLLRKCRVDSWVVELNGQLMTIKEIAKLTGLHKSTITNRIKAGLTGVELLRPAFGATKRYDVGDGRQLTINEIAAEAGINESSVRERIQRGRTGSDLLKPARAK